MLPATAGAQGIDGIDIWDDRMYNRTRMAMIFRLR